MSTTKDTKTPEKTATIYAEIPNVLKQRLDARAAARQQKLKVIIIKALEKWIDDDEKED